MYHAVYLIINKNKNKSDIFIVLIFSIPCIKLLGSRYGKLATETRIKSSCFRELLPFVRAIEEEH